MSKTNKIAIIGAGPCGTAQLQAFASAFTASGVKEGDAKAQPQIVCYEKQADWGGLWNYTWRTGLDEFGEAVHSSMYRYLWSNGPKECLEFADYSFEEHFGKPIPSYPPRAVLADYIRGRAEKSGMRKNVRFNHAVRQVVYWDKSETFTVSACDLKSGKVSREEFDYVVVATGHFATPNVPKFEGFETFNGRILHSHDFRDALEFKGQDILLIGTSYSAEDIGSQCYKYGAKSITCSHRTAPMGFHWPENFTEVPLLQKVEGNTAIFKDGTRKDVHAIILCTGYLHHFPFVANELRLETTNRLWPGNLYKGIFWHDNPRMMYLGMQDQFYTFNMFDAQAWYARDVMLGRIKLPARAEMEEHSKAWQAREEKLETDEDMIRFQGDYVQELIADTDYPDFDVEGVNQTFIEWEHHKHADIMGYRNHAHRSLITGTMQPKHPTEWLSAMDDSLEGYLKAAAG